MPSSSFIFQGIAEHQHDTHLIELLTMPGVTDFLGGVAFVKQSGVGLIARELMKVGDRASFFVGIRNDITSYQGVAALLQTGAQVWAVDTATRHRVYHPKLYLSRSPRTAMAVIGSANLTAGGLGLNVEASARLDFDLSNRKDARSVAAVRLVFDELPKQHPKHVFKIANESAAAQLLSEGRLVDEATQLISSPAGVVVRDRKDDLSPIKLMFRQRKSAAAEGQIFVPANVGTAKAVGFRLVWLSNALSERDLNIPKGPNTKPTGSIGLKRGAWTADIDHRHYFREDLFVACDWEVDPGNRRWERASIIAGLRVKGIWHGMFAFRLSHNCDTNSRTYRQNNFMTHLSWGDAKPLIARGDLLGRQLSLYRDDTDTKRPQYLIEID